MGEAGTFEGTSRWPQHPCEGLETPVAIDDPRGGWQHQPTGVANGMATSSKSRCLKMRAMLTFTSRMVNVLEIPKRNSAVRISAEPLRCPSRQVIRIVHGVESNKQDQLRAALFHAAAGRAFAMWTSFFERLPPRCLHRQVKHWGLPQDSQ